MTAYHNTLSDLITDVRISIVSPRRIDNDRIAFSGWLTPKGGRRLIVTGGELEEYEHELGSEALVTRFGDHDFARCAFKAVVRTRKPFGERYNDYVLIRPEYTDGLENSIKNSWLIPHNEAWLAIPPDENITRVTGPNTASAYSFGGATHAYRLAEVAYNLTDSLFDHRTSIVDWGCGAGRLTQHFAHWWPNRVSGIDVDPVNVEWFKSNIPHVPIIKIPWTPPTNLPEGTADLVFAYSVFSHISLAKLDGWLIEMRRHMKPNACALVTTLGPVAMAFRRFGADFFESLSKVGYIEMRNSGQLDDVRPSEDDYLNIVFSEEFARRKFSKYFDVIGYARGLGPQDVWVLRK